MKTLSRTTLAVTGAALALTAGAGGALAAGSGGGPGPRGPGPGGPPGSAAVASYLGLTEAELRAQLGAGKTLAQVASAQGKTVAGLEAAMYADAKTHLDQAVANGKLTAGQEQKMLAELKAHLDDIVNHTGPPPGGRGGPGGPPQFGAAAATYLGVTQAELRTQLESGKTLAQVATARGKSVDGLKAAILAGAKTRLDKAVAAGKITADQEKTMLDRLGSHLDDLVNRTGPPRRP